MRNLEKRILSYLVIIFIMLSSGYSVNAQTQGTNISIQPNTQITDNLSSSDEVDMFSVTLNNPGSLYINFQYNDTGDGSHYWNIEMQDSGGNKIINENTEGKTNYNTAKVRIPAGTYYIKVSYNYACTNIDYKLTANYADESSPLFEKEWDGTKDSAYGIDVNKTYTGNLPYSNDVDFYKFSITNPGGLYINFQYNDTDNASHYWNIELQDEGGNKIINENTEGKTNYNTAKVRIPAGTYYIKVTYNYACANIDYRLTANYTDESSPLFEKEWDGTKDSAYGIDVNKTYTGNLPYSNDVDFYKFSITNPGNLYIKFQYNDTDNASHYWNIELQDEAGNKIINENTEGKTNYNTAKVRIPAGTYYIKVTYNYACANIDYKLTANYTDESSALFEKEWNDTKDIAYGIDVNKTYTGNLPYSNDVDFYKFSITNPGGLYINFQYNDMDNGSHYWNIELQDEDGNKIINENTEGKTNYNTAKVRIPAGTYYIKVTYNYACANIDYKLTANYTDESSPLFEKEWNDTKDSAYGIDVNKTYTGNLPYSNDVDFYKFRVTNPAGIYINFQYKDTGNGSHYWNIELQDEGGNKIINENTAGKTNYNTAKVRISAGTYYIKVTYNYACANIDYKLTVLNPAQAVVTSPTKKDTPKPKTIQKPATPKSLSVTVKGTAATLSWSKVTGADYYKVYYKKDKGSYTSVKVTGTSVKISRLVQVAKYYFKVTAVNKAGESVPTKEIVKNTGK